MEIKYSIIIPHKNIPDLLQRCLDSIPNRNDIQVIVVDDNSDSDIVDFEHFPIWKGEHYEYYLTDEGKGAGYARNIGLQYAKGEWVLFADADDYFYPETLSELTSILIEKDISVVLFQFEFYKKDGSYYTFPDVTDTRFVLEHPYSVCSATNVLCRSAVMPWAKMVRRKHLEDNNISFEEIKWGNDMIYSTLLSLSINSFGVVPLVVYSHQWYPNSLVNKEQGLKMYYQRSLLSLKRAKLLNKANRLDYNIFTDQWFKRVYYLNYPCSIILIIRSVLSLGPKYCIKNWSLFTNKHLYLTRMLVKRMLMRV